MTTENINYPTDESQSLEVLACLAEIHQAVWYSLDMLNILAEQINSSDSQIGRLTPVGAAGLLSTVEAANLKIMTIAGRLKDELALEDFDWGDIQSKPYELNADPQAPLSAKNREAYHA
ncbi:MAG: hypothetical protein NXI15_05620 [Gammaproteobacteria bacterium]|nr:hypothetical protein [Gammaproteobacteria bacterium]